MMSKVKATRDRVGVKVACTHCHAQGTQTYFDRHDDENECECVWCDGKGYHWAPRWAVADELTDEDWRAFPSLAPCGTA